MIVLAPSRASPLPQVIAFLLEECRLWTLLGFALIDPTLSRASPLPLLECIPAGRSRLWTLLGFAVIDPALSRASPLPQVIAFLLEEADCGRCWDLR
ncbi:TPA: hypothetical protein ACKP2V_005350 [Pseudomonas putida]